MWEPEESSGSVLIPFESKKLFRLPSLLLLAEAGLIRCQNTVSLLCTNEHASLDIGIALATVYQPLLGYHDV